MTTIELKTESYLFESSGGRFRAIPFFELSIDEWVIFQNGHPKYFLDFNQRTAPLIVELRKRMEQGEDLDTIINQIGRYLGLSWTIRHNIQGKEINGSEQPEKVSVKRLDDFSEIALELTFIATDQIESDVLLNDEKLFDKYLTEDENGQLGIEICLIDGNENLEKFINFIFKKTKPLNVIKSTSDKNLVDLSAIKSNFISLDDLESQYKDWIEISGRENSMDEYGTILGIIAYLERNRDKKYLVLRTEKKNTVPNSTLPKAGRKWWQKLFSSE
jgi:hypothetical protein